jgi:hypothetical protein
MNLAIQSGEKNEQHQTKETNTPPRKIDLKKVKRRVIFWTVFAIVIAYATMFFLDFANNASAIVPGVIDNKEDCESQGSTYVWEENGVAPGVCYNIGNHNCGTDTFFNWGCKQTKATYKEEQITPFLITILNWLAIGVTIAVIAGIIFGAVQYTTSGGNPAQAQKAIGLIRNAVIALILYFARWALLNFLVPGGLFSS